MTNEDTYTDIIVVLDRSGSMSSVKDDTIGGFNAFLEEQKKVPGNAKVTLVQFDDEYEVVYEGVPLEEVEPLTDETFIPRGWTALLDAMGRTIATEREKIRTLPDDEAPDQVVVAVLTDGHENASQEFKRTQVFEMVNDVQDDGWEIMYLGADAASIEEAKSYGVLGMNSYCYDGHFVNADGTTVSGTTGACNTMSQTTRNYRLSGKKIKKG